MQKILGLDFGSYSIKAVEITQTFNAYRVERFYEVAVPEIEGIEQELVEYSAIRQLFSENSIEVDRTYTAMNGLLVSTRTFNFQNVKKRDVPLVVQNELETNAPFSLEETIIDQQIIDVTGGTTNVLSAMCRMENIEAFLSALKDLEIEPKVIDVDYLTYINLYSFLNFSESRSHAPQDLRNPVWDPGDRCKLILDIGHMKTAMILFNGNNFVTARTIRMGGRYITEMLSKGLGVTYGEAQRLKHAVSYLEYKPESVPAPGNEREFMVAQQMGLAATDLVKEIIRTLHSFKAQERLVPSQILVTGGTACIRNIVNFLEDSIEIPIKLMSFDESRLKIDEADDDKGTILSQALAIAMRGVPGKLHSQINLRKGELALVGSYDAVFKQIANISLLAFGLVACLMGSYSIRWWLYSDQIDTLKKQFQTEIKQTLGSEPKELKNISSQSNWDLKNYSERAFKIMDQDNQSKKAAIENFLNLKSAVPLKVLRDVSLAIDKKITVDITNFHVHANGTADIEGETVDLATAEKLGTIIRGVGSFQSVKVNNPERIPGSDKVKFSMTATIKEVN
ncbi:MAG: pilus assembly protein PilM [Silvanigrellaceae bacterium]